jgi:hypothetical protein
MVLAMGLQQVDGLVEKAREMFDRMHAAILPGSRRRCCRVAVTRPEPRDAEFVTTD